MLDIMEMMVFHIVGDSFQDIDELLFIGME
jgi:hypothetical protein